jgi:hypothetical protein
LALFGIRSEAIRSTATSSEFKGVANGTPDEISRKNPPEGAWSMRAMLSNPALAAAAVFALPVAAQQPKRTIDVSPPFEAELVADLREP